VNSTASWYSPRSSVPFSTRTTNGTVTPRSVVVVATSPGGLAGSYDWNCPVAEDLYMYVYFVGALHCASRGGPNPAATVPHTHGCTCAPANTGPPTGWFVIVIRVLDPSGRRALSTFGPAARPVTSPSKRPSGRRANAEVTSRRPT
jgi:hypothetical protein